MLTKKLNNLSFFSNKTGLPQEILAEMFKVESNFNELILKEKDFYKRKELYDYVYSKSAELVEPYSKDYFGELVKAKSEILKIFKKEVDGKSIIDIGSGSGAFLYAIAKSKLDYKSLYGLDVKAPTLPKDKYSDQVKCFQRNVIDFELPQTFEVAILDNVYEHIALDDKDLFLNSISKSLVKGGKLVLLIPNKLFGPTDWTILIDNSHTGKIKAQCLHLDETTFKDVIKTLEIYGFSNFISPLPFIAFNKVRQFFPNFRLPSKFYAALENSLIIRKLKKVKFKGKSIVRMEIVIIAEKIR
ncbi:methyltransferase domain-containing protein [Lacihabitans sp. LS3-19]|uniref:class I SAM-dependent methyltransferase n=1 Tax=Lacihabitans sp. LS3-19 TaxID=2487335 RepID=UPI0020CFD990|nr:methyltransferase domain-containing protein [Lacihabitans sp. LS3-19]MCP9767656.1 methyltransferase domain-containing protein [Lacihabitans sp. LS3-19]